MTRIIAETAASNAAVRAADYRRDAEAAGYYVREGSYQGTTDDQLGRWYVGRDGEHFRPFGRGHGSEAEAWKAAAELADISG